MQISNPEIHRVTIGEVEIVPESDWILVGRKKKTNSSLFIPCTKSSCNSKSHSKDRCWWINPELRSNYKFSTVPKHGSECEHVNQKVSKVIILHVSDHRSLMKSHHDYILRKILQESNSEIRIH